MGEEELYRKLKQAIHDRGLYGSLSLDGVTLSVHDGEVVNYFSFLHDSLYVTTGRISYGRYSWFGTSTVLYQDIDDIQGLGGSLYLYLKSGSYITFSLYDESKRSGWEEKSC